MTHAISIQEEEYHERFSLRVWRRLLAFARPYWRHYIGLMVASLALAGTEAAFPLVTRGVIDDIKARGREANLVGYATVYAGLSLTLAAEILVFIRLAGVISTRISHDIRRAGFGHLQELSFSFFDRRPAGWLVARLTSDCDRLSRTVSWGFLDLAWGTCLVVGITAVMLAVHWKLALLVLTIVPPLAWVSLAFQKRILAAYRAVRKENSNITAAVSESIAGVRTTKALGREGESLGEYEAVTERMRIASYRSAVLTSMYFPIIMTLGSIGAGLALWYGGLGTIAGAVSLGTLVLFVDYSGRLVWPILETARVFADLQSTQAAAERIIALLETAPAVKDTPEAARAVAAYRDLPRREGVAVDGGNHRIDRVEFRHVSFAYEPPRTVLSGFNLTVRAGQTVALVGPTGGGKTTVVNLLCRFYEPTGGEVLLDGVEYRRRSLAWLQSNLGIVLQEPHLFSGTVRDNIRYGRLEATDEQLEQAARVVRAHEFIARMEDGYDSQVGQGGGKLSTGQKQLVSFARAVLADPQIFVMDEATSSIDTETERLIQEGLHAVLAGRISFVIAHRLSTIRSANLILVIDGGRVIEQGTHAELIGRRGRYYDLYTNQFAEERAEAVLRGNG